MTKRVYHPSLSAWQDVPDDDAKDWKDAGWRLTKPEHVDDSDAPEVGAWAPVDVPVFLEPDGDAGKSSGPVVHVEAAPAKADEK